MGDRALVVFKSGKKYSPALYTHWSGANIEAWLTDAAPNLRKGDPAYAAARFCGYCHNKLLGDGVGLCLLAPPTQVERAQWDKYSHGDAGVYIVDVDTGQVEAHGGYGKPMKIQLGDF